MGFLSIKMIKNTWFTDLLFLVLGLSFFYGVVLCQFFPLIIPDEGRYAEIAREMLQMHHWVIPTLDYATYIEKPPLFYWLSAFVFKMFGVHLGVARLVTVFFAVSGCVLSYVAGRKFYTRRCGLIAAVASSVTLLYYVLGHYNNIDMSVSILLSTTLILFLLGIAREGHDRRFLLWGAYIFSALAVLDKGLIGIVFPMMFIASWILIRRDWLILKRMHIFSGLLLFLLVALPWHVLAQEQAPQFFDYYFIEQQFSRYIHFQHGHHMSLLTYTLVVVGTLFPWVLLLPTVCADLFSKGWRFINTEPVLLFLCIWFVEVILFFAHSSSMLIGYLQPITIPFVLLVAYSLDMHWHEKRRAMKIAGIVFAVFCLILGMGCLLVPLFWNSLLSDLPPAEYPWVQWLALPLLIAALVNFKTAGLTVRGVFGGLIFGMASLLLGAYVSLPVLNQNTTAPIAQVLQELFKKYPAAVVATYGIYPQDLPFYLQHPVTVVNWTSDEFSFALRAGVHPNWVDGKMFDAAWRGALPMFVLVDNTDPEVVAHFKGACCLVRHYNYELFANKAVDPQACACRLI